MAQKFVISTNQLEVEEAVQQIEQDFTFRTIQAIKSLRLSREEEQVVLEISRCGRCSLEQLQTRLGGQIAQLPELLGRMVSKTYLVAAPATLAEAAPLYVLSFILQPPRPLSPDVALSINNQINQGGGTTTAYVRHIYNHLGEPGLDIISNVMSEQGQKYAGALAEVRGGSAEIVGRRFIELMRVNGAKLEVLEAGPQALVYRQHECPYKLQPGETRLCGAVNEFDQALLGELGCRLRFTARLVDGASHCQAVIEKIETN